MKERVTDILQRWQSAKDNRSLWNQHWEDLARVMLTRRLGFITATLEGDRRMEDLYDGTAIQAARALANTIGGMLRPEGEKWFGVKVSNTPLITPEGEILPPPTGDEVDDWLEDTAERMRAAMDDPRSRFRQATGECDLDLVVLGTAPMYIGEIVGQSRLIFQGISLKDGVPSFGEDGVLEAMFFSRRFTLRQAVKRWGAEKLSEATRRKLDDNKKLDEKIEFLFAVMPRKEVSRRARGFARTMPIADIVIEVEARHEVLVGGFHEMPYIAPRWDTTAGEDYGRSPGMIALPDANTSQAIGETMLIAGQRAADPALLTPSDAFIDAPNTFPGGLAHYEADAVRDLGFDPFKVLETGSNLPLTREIQNDTRLQIKSAFLRDLFKLPQPGEAVMTATEVNARLAEFIRELGPVFGRLESDYTAPMVERVFNIMLRADGLAPIPEVLQGRGIVFEYESPVKKIRQLSAANAAREWVIDMAEMEQTKPGAMDIVNVEAYGRFRAEALGVPHELVNGKDELEAIQQARAEEQQKAEQMQQLEAATKVAGALPDSVIEGAVQGVTEGTG